jgi:hypothetical protein
MEVDMKNRYTIEHKHGFFWVKGLVKWEHHDHLCNQIDDGYISNSDLLKLFDTQVCDDFTKLKKENARLKKEIVWLRSIEEK